MIRYISRKPRRPAETARSGRLAAPRGFAVALVLTVLAAGSVAVPAGAATLSDPLASSITAPVSGGLYSPSTFAGCSAGSGMLCGTASGSGLSAVQVRIQRSSDGFWYDGSKWGSTAFWLNANGTTSWTYPLSPKGSTQFTVSTRAMAGSTAQSTPTTATFAWDNVAPTTSIVVAPRNPSNTAAPSFSFSSDDPTAIFQCRLDPDKNAQWQSCGTPVVLSVLDGQHTLEVRAVDPAGNVDSAPASYKWMVDTVAPSTNVSGPTGVVASSTASISASSEPGASYECNLDGAGWQSCTSTQAFAGLVDGPHSLLVRATDAAGNADPTPAAISWTVDTTAPEVTISAGPSGVLASSSATASFSSNDPTAVFQCRVDSGSWGSCTSPKSWTGLADGSHTIAVKAIDKVGNATASPATRSWRIDTVAPRTSLTSVPSSSADSGDSFFTFRSTEPASSYECSVDSGSWTGCTSSRAVAGLSIGSHTFKVRARDAAGNVDALPATYTWSVTSPTTDSGSTTGSGSGSTLVSGGGLSGSSGVGSPDTECRNSLGTGYIGAKIDSINENNLAGTWTDPVTGFSTTITDVDSRLHTFSYVSNWSIRVLVKGGSGTPQVYSDSISGTGLHAPLNTSTKQVAGDFYGLSHITFCWRPGGRITVTKKTTTGTSQAFSFGWAAGGGQNGFSLTNGKSKSFIPPVGSFTIGEFSLPSGWGLQGIACSHTATGGSWSIALPAVSISLSSGDNVTCVFTNSTSSPPPPPNPGQVIVRKVADPSTSTERFPFSGIGSSFDLADGDSQSFTVSPGTYTVSELATAGWRTGSIVCDDGGDSTGNVSTATATYRVQSGETVTCTFSNVEDTPGPAQITIRKTTDPSGGSGSFDFAGPGTSDSFTVQDGQSWTTEVDPGTYTVTEAAQAGWRLTDITCTGASVTTSGRTVTINAGSGANVDCTFTNQQRAKLTITKFTDPSGSSQSFDFDGGSLGSFSLGDGGSRSFYVTPGTYSVSELPLMGWHLSDLSCSGSNSTTSGSTATVTLTADDDVTCQFTNVKESDGGGTGGGGNGVGSPDYECQTSLGAGYYGFKIDSGNFNGTWTDPYSGFKVRIFNVDTSLNTFSYSANFPIRVLVKGGSGSPTQWPTSTSGTGLHAPLNDSTSKQGDWYGLSHITFCWRPAGVLRVTKRTQPASSTKFAFTLGGIGSDSFEIGDGQSWTIRPPAGTYTVTEGTNPAGWSLQGLSCTNAAGSSHSTISGATASVALAYGDDITCTYTNVQKAVVRIVKQASPSGTGKTFSFTSTDLPDSSFSLAGGEEKSWTVDPGTYHVTESSEPDWALTSLACDNGGSVPVLLSRSVAISAVGGQTVTCTFVNTANKGRLIVKKLTDPSGSPETFAFSSPDLPSDDQSFSLGDGQTKSIEVTSGTYHVTEGTKSGWRLDNLTCDDSDSTVSDRTATFRIAPSETVMCTYTNASRVATIKIVKNTDPAGSSQSFGFTSPDLPRLTNGAFNLTDGQTRTFEVLPGTYSVTEDSIAGWDLRTLSCDDSDSSVDVSSRSASIVASDNETVTCTFTNRLRDGVMVVKKLTDPSGSGQSFDFTSSDLSGGDASFSLSDGDTRRITVRPGTYGVTESQTSGWALKNLSCDDSDSSVSKPNRKATFKVAADEVVTCTFTNSEAATIKIVKETTPVNASDTFNFTSPDLPSSSFSLRGGRESVFSVAAGTYTVTESALTGWDLAGLSCSNGASTTSLAGRTATIVAGSGQTVTCTFLNVKRANITIAKKTDPEGSYQSFGFTSPNLPSSSFSLSDGQTKTMSVAPGTYSVTETTTARWDLVGLVCSNDSSRGDVPTATATIVASAGDNITCTYTNKAQPLPGTVTIRKQTEPAGSSQTFRFTSTNLPQRAFTLGDMQSNTQTVTAGTYRVTESLISGWAVASITCDDRDSSGNPSNGQLIVVVDPGEDVTCTYVNRAADATIVIKKTTLPSVSQQDFTFDGGSLGTFSLRGGQSKTLTVRPGRYQISEDELPGWDLASLFCTDSSARVDGANVTLTVAPASRVTCTYTNAQRGTVTIAKSTAPAGSDEYFQFQSADLPSDSFWLSDGETRTFDVPAGTYRVTEAQVEGWSLTRLVCDSSGSGGSIATRQATIVVPAGRDVTCTWTNSMNATINITKRTEPTGDDTRFGFSTTMGASFTLGDGETKTFSIRPGSYTVTEATKAGWQLTGIECDGATPVLSARRVTINATAGATIDCTYTNDKESAQVIIRKITNPAGASQVFSFSPDSSLGGGDFDLGHGEEKIFDVAPGTFTVSELPTIDSWELQGISCDDSDSTASGLTATIRVKNKETVTCVFTNRPKTASMCGDVFEDIAVNGLKDGEDINIPGSKVLLDLNNNGQADPGEPIVDSSNGTYCFNNLVPGKYRVLVQLPSGGYKCLLPTRCDDSRTIGWGKNPGPPLSAIRTGYATLEGTQFEDKNKDGSPRQPTDPLLPGWKVFVDYNGNGIQDPGEPSAVTDENGFYKISRVRAGRYTLRSIPPASTPYVCTYPQTCSRTAQIVIPPSGLNEVKKQDFGAILPASRRRINIRIAARCQRSGIPVRVAASGARYVVVSLFGRRATDATVDRSGAYSFFFRTPRGTRPGPHRLRIDVRYLGVRTASTRTFYRTASICPPRSKPKFSG